MCEIAAKLTTYNRRATVGKAKTRRRPEGDSGLISGRSRDRRFDESEDLEILSGELVGESASAVERLRTRWCRRAIPVRKL